MLKRLGAEREACLTFIESLRADANKDNRDMTASEMEQVKQRQDRILEIEPQIEMETRSIELSRRSIPMIASALSESPADVQYERASEWALDMWRAGVGQPEAEQRMRRYLSRVAGAGTGRM
jgi:hypothetical protein